MTNPNISEWDTSLGSDYNYYGSPAASGQVKLDRLAFATEGSSSRHHSVASILAKLKSMVEDIDMGDVNDISHNPHLTAFPTYDDLMLGDIDLTSTHSNHNGTSSQSAPIALCPEDSKQRIDYSLGDLQVQDGAYSASNQPSARQDCSWQDEARNHPPRVNCQASHFVQQTDARIVRSQHLNLARRHSDEIPTKSGKQRIKTHSRSSRAAHCDSERRYRKNLSESIEMLRDQLPPLAQGLCMNDDLEGDPKSLSKASVISTAINYIQDLETTHAHELARTVLMAEEISVLRSMSQAAA